MVKLDLLTKRLKSMLHLSTSQLKRGKSHGEHIVTLGRKAPSSIMIFPR